MDTTPCSGFDARRTARHKDSRCAEQVAQQEHQIEKHKEEHEERHATPSIKVHVELYPHVDVDPPSRHRTLSLPPSLLPPCPSARTRSSVRVFSSCLQNEPKNANSAADDLAPHPAADKPREHCSWRRPSKPSFPLRRRYPSPASRAKRPMENLLYNGLGGLRRSADEGSLLHDTRPYAAKKREERAFVRARAAAHSAAHSKSASAPATAVHPLADHQVAAATTPSRVHVPFGQTEGEPLEVCESLSPSKAHAPGNAVPVHELHTRMPDAACGEEEPESCGLPARRTWDEGGATTGAVAPRGTPKGPCTPPQPKEAQHGTCFIRSNTADGMPGLEPVEDMPAHPSLGSSWQAMQKRKEEDLRVCVDEDSDALACGGGDDKENMHTNGSWFCNVRTPSTVIVSPIESDPDKMPLAAPHAEPANNKRRRDFQTDPLGHAACGGSSSTPRSAQDNLVTHDGMYDIMCLNSH